MPLLFELHSNCAETQGPCPSYPPSTQPHADGLAQGKKLLWGSVAQWIAHWTSRLPGKAIQRLWVRVPPEL